MMQLTSLRWTDYELIDTGNREKLERFGKYTLARPEPQAVWQKAIREEEWENLADAWFRRSGKQEDSKTGSERGEWRRKRGVADQWLISYNHDDLRLKFRLGLTSFGHIGVFPEQAENWEYVYRRLKKKPGARILNLFAYTGGLSLAARVAGADVTHVDSVKPVITWAREIMEASGLDGIRWVVEDALKFVRREARRGNLYDGIILDPPAYGRGPEGEKWVLEESIDEIISLCSKILQPQQHFFILSLYSMGFSSLIGENLVTTHFPKATGLESGEFYFPDRAGRKLPLGTVVRFSDLP
ncbi:MAG TPA: class I SAM-dependent methyltransferase [Bacteroidales bacterium]|nr:class I SAM-dependent methyltransferase [Bacteroidales bacterium]HPS72894.1 class I SAM-dependent methyltransferase [Bacteroidales bacterium]